MKKIILSICILLAASSVFAQSSVDRVALTFSDPNRPGLLEAGLISGSITVKGYAGKEIVVEATTRTKRYSDHHDDDDSNRDSRGLRRIGGARSTGLTVEEEDNVLTVSAASHRRAVDLNIKVPLKTSLNISTVNGGSVLVEDVEGEMELNNTNGSIEAYNVSGSVLANTTNGKVEVAFKKVTPDKPMSFVSFNGKVDVTFPNNIKADVKMKSDQGEVYSDFDIALEDKPKVIKEDARGRGGKYRVRVESAIFGKINGGGPTYHFSTFNGNIYIRKSR